MQAENALFNAAFNPYFLVLFTVQCTTVLSSANDALQIVFMVMVIIKNVHIFATVAYFPNLRTRHKFLNYVAGWRILQNITILA